MSVTKYKWLSVLIIAFALVGCNQNKGRMQAFKYHENAKRRPIVAMLPVISRVDNYLPWNLSEEFTSEIQRRLMNRSVIYLNSVDVPAHLRSKLQAEDSVMLTKADFQELSVQNDFVVLLELIEHSEKPCNNLYLDTSFANHSMDRVLNMKMRVKVIDLRAGDLKVVLQEIIHVDHLIPRDSLNVDYDRVIWGSDSFAATAYGRAHAKLESDLSKQIENYVSIAH